MSKHLYMVIVKTRLIPSLKSLTHFSAYLLKLLDFGYLQAEDGLGFMSGKELLHCTLSPFTS